MLGGTQFCPHRLHDEAAVVPAARLHDAPARRGGGRPTSAARRRAPHAVDRRGRRADRPAAARARLRRPTTCRRCRPSSSAADRRRPRSCARRASGSAPTTRSATRRPSRAGSAPRTAFDAPDDEALHTVGRPRPGVEVRIDEGDGEAARSGSPAAMIRLLARSRGAPRSDARRRMAAHRRPRPLDDRRLPRASSVGPTEMYIRGGYNVHPAGGRGGARSSTRRWPPSRSCPGPRRDGRDRCRRRRPATASAPPTLDELRAFASEPLAAYKLPDVESSSSTRCHSRQWTSSTAGALAGTVANRA